MATKLGLSRILAATAVVAAGTAGVGVATTLPASAGVGPCNSGTVNWVATYPTFNDWLYGQSASHCIGFKGTWNVPLNSTQVFCAGNNEGTWWYHDYTTNRDGAWKFSPDRSYSIVNGLVGGANPGGDYTDVYKVQITGWSGSAGC